MTLCALRYQASGSRREDAALQRRLGRALLAWALEKGYGLALESLEIIRGEHGKPFFRGHPVHFNLAHCPGLICCGLSSEEIGVDCERRRPVGEALIRRVCAPEELAWLSRAEDRDRAFLTLWTLKEAYVKYLGEGISYGLPRASFRWEHGLPVAPDAGLSAACWETPPDCFFAVCGREVPCAPLFVGQGELQA